MSLTPCEAQRAASQPFEVETVSHRVAKRSCGGGRGGSASQPDLKLRSPSKRSKLFSDFLRFSQKFRKVFVLSKNFSDFQRFVRIFRN